MSTKSTIGNHKNFLEKLREFIGTDMYQKLEPLKIRIHHIKKIRIKIEQEYGLLSSELFKVNFVKVCSNLIQRLEKLVASSQSYSKSTIKKIISDLFLAKASI